jgi:PKD repeat protein
MKKFLFLVNACSCFFIANAQSPKDCSVELWATVQSSPPQITLNWLSSATTTNYAVARKLKNSAVWSTLAPSLAGGATQYVDNTSLSGVDYEYRVIRNGTNYTGYGYISSGIEVPEVDFRGKLILLIDNTHTLTLAPELARLEEDLESDGWTVIKNIVDPTWPVTQVKDSISNIYFLDPLNTKALFLFGHVPVPYSGNFGPDAHPDHQGAWPADTYYGEMDGSWTDFFVTSTTVSPVRTQNVPGDGKFDQSLLPSPVELQVGRVDLWGMSSFSLTETQLLKNYLDKDHDYRKKIITAADAAVIDDNFGYMTGEVFAASGFKNFGPLVNPANVIQADYFTTLAGPASYKWSYGCGGGNYTGAAGIGTTANFASSNHQGIFTMLFGSYFGDWDIQNNFLRAPLCQGKTLTNAWAGRPQWMFHHMGMGENIGYSTRITQNNTTTYFPSPFPMNFGIFNTVHIALMGDPTLRQNIVAPVSNVVATKVGYDCVITWSVSPEPNIIGYNIYMKNDTNVNYTKLNFQPITSTSYTDYCLPYLGTYKYMVRALKLETTPSGSYYNLSEGIADTALNTTGIVPFASFTAPVFGTSVTVVNTSTNASTYAWDFGNGITSTSVNPAAGYTLNGTYTITLIASNPCSSDTAYQIVTINSIDTKIKEPGASAEIGIWPNPTTGKIKLYHDLNETGSLVVFNAEGKKVFEKEKVRSGEEINLGFLSKGVYLLQYTGASGKIGKKLVLE